MSTEKAPALEFTAGNPTDEEIAAVTAVVLALGASAVPALATASTASDRRRKARRRLQLSATPGPWRSGRF